MVTICFESGFLPTTGMLRRARPKTTDPDAVLRRRIACNWPLLAAALSLLAPPAADASSSVRGTETVFKSPSGAAEKCVALRQMPGGNYSPDDAAMERALCSVDFYGVTHALCAKVFSTSPGTLVFDLRGGPYAGDPARFERENCGSGTVHKRGAPAEPISFKMSVNTRESSATFANASLVYYHFARYFDASAHVPVAVFRSIDRLEHSRRVSAAGVRLSAGKPGLAMNHAAWVSLAAAEQDPASYKPTEELFTPDGLLYGVMLHPRGKRYGEEMNGTRRSGWGDGQNRDFQRTAPFLALRSARPLRDAIAEGLDEAMRDPVLAKAMGRGTTAGQVAFWMSDLVDVTLLDYVLGQQDRVGNVDYLPYWYWVDGGTVRREATTGNTPPPQAAAHNPQRIRRTEIGDNDAGVRVTYMNYARRTGMLDNLRHYRAETYRRLLRLDADFTAAGPLHEHVRTTFGLSDREFAAIKANVRSAAVTLRDACRAGRLRFDVEPEEFLLTGAATERRLDCEKP